MPIATKQIGHYDTPSYSEKKFLKISYISYTGIQNLQEIQAISGVG